MTKSKFNPDSSRDQNSKQGVHNFEFVISNLKWAATTFFITISCSNRGPKFQQYYAQGQVLYEKNCSNCHQKNGNGLGLVYPPLAVSDYYDKNLNSSLCLMKYGTKGEIMVNGKSFNKPMPGVPSLTELEIAEIATYLNNAWGRQQGIVEITQASAALKACEDKGSLTQ